MRKRISYILILTMLFTGVYMVPAVQEVHGEEAAGAISISFLANSYDAEGARIDINQNLTVEFDGTDTSFPIEPAYVADVVRVEISYYTAFDSEDVAVADISAGGTTLTPDEASGVCEVSWGAISADITFSAIFEEPAEPAPGDAPTVTVNGSNATYGGYVDMEIYSYHATTGKESGEIVVTMGEGRSYEEGSSESDLDISYTSSDTNNIFTYSGFTETTSVYLYLFSSEYPNLRIVLELKYSTGSSGGGGGGSSSKTEDPVDVKNETNEPNESSDTILTPTQTSEEDGKSTTDVRASEVDALINLAEKHVEDVPEGENEAVINIEDQTEGGNTEYAVGIQHSDADELSNSVIDIVSINTPIGDFRIRTDELAKQLKKDNGKLRLRLLKIENKERPGVDAELVVGDAEVVTFEGTYEVEIRIPYEPAENEDVSALYIEYIAEDGSTVTVTESKYDAENKWLVFYAPHLSKYGVAYNPVLFKDVPAGNWASSYVTFLATRGVINGMGDGKFYPNARVTKAQFINMMTKAFSAAKLGKNVIKSYKDVPTDAWYAKSMGWSYMNNLSNVLAVNGRIHPDEALTREDMATLSNNISLGLGLRLKDNKGTSTFSDSGSISGYAASGVQRMTSCGILAGTGGKFFPKQGLTRAEAAKVISTLMTGMK